MNHAHRRRAIWAIAVMAFVLCRPAYCQLPHDDPVEELRDVLSTPRTAEARAAELGQCIDGLRTLDDLRRALILPEWRDFYKHGAVATADSDARLRVAQRFGRAVRHSLTTADTAGQVAVIELLGAIGESAKSDDFAAGALRSFGPDLAARVKQGPEALRTAAARALGQIHADPELTIPVLRYCLASESAALRRAAAEGLRSLCADLEAVRGASAAGETLAASRSLLVAATRGLGDAELHVRRCCAELIAVVVSNMGRLTDCLSTEEQRNNQLRTMLTDCATCAPALAKVLCDADCEVLASAARAFEEMGTLRSRYCQTEEEDDPLVPGLRQALPTLRVAVDSVNVVTRRRVVEVLEMIGPEKSTTTPLLIHALSDSDRFVRWVAVRALSATPLGPSSELLTALTARLKDRDLDIRRAAARGLEQLARRPITDAPIRVIPTGAEPSDAVLASAVAPLWRSLRSSEASLRLESLQALQQMGSNAKPAVPLVIEVLRDPDARVRRQAAELLGSLGKDALPALPELHRAAHDEAPEVRHAAREAVLKIRR